jgi:16S rRNA (adenine1518-N6/adenine1519-N6)-dimethyltransferase
LSCGADLGRRLGQHFLNSSSILERIAAVACGEHAGITVEIGPGRGSLTEKLLARSSRVIAIEIDGSLVDHLRRRFSGDSRLEVVHADVLAADLSRFGAETVVGNIPYYITSPIVEKVVRLSPPPARAVLLMQKEVAVRLAATPGTRDYGFLTVQTAFFADVRKLFDVKPGAFQPPPEVDSSVVLFEPRDKAAALGIGDVPAFLEFLSRCFRQKRKTLRNNLAPYYQKAGLGDIPDTKLRAEQTSLESLAMLYRRLVS